MTYCQLYTCYVSVSPEIKIMKYSIYCILQLKMYRPIYQLKRVLVV